MCIYCSKVSIIPIILYFLSFCLLPFPYLDILVINSARVYLKEHYERFLKQYDLFLIADECHRYGSKENSKIFKVPFSYTLGLSATPERHGDFGFEEKLIPSLGDVIYTYTYSDALKDGIMPPYKIIRLLVRLTRAEQVLYEELSRDIKRLVRALFIKYPNLQKYEDDSFNKNLTKLSEKSQNKLAMQLIALLNKRKSIIHASESKLYALKWLFSNEITNKEKVLIFHERIEIAEQIYSFLKEKGFAVGIYHSKMHINERLENISKFRDRSINILVTCKALDEGFDVPAAETGIIVAGTSSVRQWIQRMGRILRRSPNKEYSKIYVIFAEVVEKDIFKKADLEEFEKRAFGVELICFRL